MTNLFFGIIIGAIIVALILFASFPAFYKWLADGTKTDIKECLLKGLVAFGVALVICYLAS